MSSFGRLAHWQLQASARFARNTASFARLHVGTLRAIVRGVSRFRPWPTPPPLLDNQPLPVARRQQLRDDGPEHSGTKGPLQYRTVGTLTGKVIRQLLHRTPVGLARARRARRGMTPSGRKGPAEGASPASPVKPLTSPTATSLFDPESPSHRRHECSPTYLSRTEPLAAARPPTQAHAEPVAARWRGAAGFCALRQPE